MRFSRTAGLLIHPSSLPGPSGIGTLGAEAREFIDFLASAGLGLWQTLPLGPTGYGDSPYQCLSAFAGNPFLIDLGDGGHGSAGRAGAADREAREAREACEDREDRVDFGALFRDKNDALDAAWDEFRHGSLDAFEDFCRIHAGWLDDYALYSAVKETMDHESWDRWPAALRNRDAAALRDFASARSDRILRHKFVQFLFFGQWESLHRYAKSRNVRIIGDIPIFVAYDSADTWAHPELFRLDEDRRPVSVAGVPPDYFAETGQLWGNPLYDWEANRREGYAWWISRIRASLGFFDILRIDHFRGFEACWSVPAGDSTAERGVWEPGPGIDLFSKISEALGDVPIIAEDLGFMTPEVHALRDTLGFPGMKILQFAFEPEEENCDYPHTYPQNSVVYTGTHDNDTCAGWIHAARPEAVKRALRYIGGGAGNFAWNMIRTAWASPACMAITPVQDLLGLGSEARMNFPGRKDGWWTWRLKEGALTPALARKLKALNLRYFRLAGRSRER